MAAAVKQSSTISSVFIGAQDKAEERKSMKGENNVSVREVRRGEKKRGEERTQWKV